MTACSSTQGPKSAASGLALTVLAVRDEVKSAAGQVSDLKAWGNYAVWIESDSATGFGKTMVLRDTARHSSRVIAAAPAGKFIDLVDASGHTIVYLVAQYQQANAGQDVTWAIEAVDVYGSSTVQVATSAASDNFFFVPQPRIDGDWVAWSQVIPGSTSSSAC